MLPSKLARAKICIVSAPQLTAPGAELMSPLSAKGFCQAMKFACAHSWLQRAVFDEPIERRLCRALCKAADGGLSAELFQDLDRTLPRSGRARFLLIVQETACSRDGECTMMGRCAGESTPRHGPRAA